MLIRIGVYILGILLVGSNLCSQQVYFNNRYHLSNSDAFCSATSVLQYNDKYYITGATEDTIDQNWRWVFFSQLSDTGLLEVTKYIGNNENYFYPARPGSFYVHQNSLFFAGNKAYFSPYHVAGLLVKLTPDLDTIWTSEYLAEKSLPYDSSQIINNMGVCTDNGFVFTGELYFGQQPSQVALLKVDSLGSQKFIKYFGVTGLNAGYSVIQTSDGGYAIGGFWYIPGSSVYTGDPIVIKTDSLGNKEWEKNLGGQYLDGTAWLSLNTQGNIIVACDIADSMLGDDQPFNRTYVSEIDNNGNIIWNNIIGQSVVYNFLKHIRCLDDGSIILCGTVLTDFPHMTGWVLKLSDVGDSLWYRQYDYLAGYASENNLFDIIPTGDNGYLACGFVLPRPPDTGTKDIWLLKLDSMGCDTPGCDPSVGISPVWHHAPDPQHLHIFPNPATSIVTVRPSFFVARSSVFIYDIYGRKQDEIIISKGQEQTRIDVLSYPDGVYIVVLKDQNKVVARGKFVKSNN